MTRRGRTGGGRVRDQDLALVLARLEAAFGPVTVLEVRPHPQAASRRRPAGPAEQNGAAQAQGVLALNLDLDDEREGVGRSPAAVDAR